MGYCNLRCETEIVAQRRNLEIVRNDWSSTGETILRMQNICRGDRRHTRCYGTFPRCLVAFVDHSPVLTEFTNLCFNISLWFCLIFFSPLFIERKLNDKSVLLFNPLTLRYADLCFFFFFSLIENSCRMQFYSSTWLRWLFFDVSLFYSKERERLLTILRILFNWIDKKN